LNLLNGIAYYKNLFENTLYFNEFQNKIIEELNHFELELENEKEVVV
jgi:hypothetical protein